MPTIVADIDIRSSSTLGAAKSRRLPRLIGLGAAALVSLALWCGLFAIIGALR
ncbi:MULTISPECIES: hypothetical protein [unclassified Caulobacter]|uniref:hypothetical protein n=1 Tax=unclassified Caulobacter TaxID=2648921 RepID=UPI000AE154A6|nr:hypothetical protein [Caulobacter sp. UNC358MFTsu5.1]